MIGSNKKRKINRNGFTLMEVLVVLALTIILMTAIVSVFILSLRAQRQASARQEILSASRAVVENIARSIRTSEIDFAASYAGDGDAGISGIEEELYLIDSAGREVIYFNDAGGEIKMLIDGQETALTDPAKVKVTKFQFDIPYDEDLLVPQGHPRATVVLEFQSVGIRPEEIKRINLQTTVSSRVYKQ